ncbi:SCO7460 family lipoprotein [Streptomyces tendae]
MGRRRTARRSGRRRTGRVGGGLAALLVGLLASTGCAAFDTDEDVRRARELADELYPGELDVVDARTLFPETTGSEVTLSVADDPDAAVRFRVDAGKDRCDGGPDCAAALREAVDRALREAGHLRAMRTAFDGCGYPVLATDESLTTPWIEARVTDGTLDDVLTRVGACVQRWVTARTERNGQEVPGWVTVDFAAPGAVEDLPAPKSGLPTVLRLTHGPRLAALSDEAYYVAAYPVGGDAGRTVDAASARLRIVSPFEERQAFSRRIDASVLPALRETYPDAVTAGGAGMGVWRLEQGTLRRMRGYVLFCERPPAHGKQCLGDLAALVTSDPQGRDAEVVRVLTDLRDEHGVLRLPPR